MKFKAQMIAAFLKGEIEGNPEVEVENISMNEIEWSSSGNAAIFK